MHTDFERKFQKIYENVATGIALTKLDGRFEECNAAYSALTGYSQTELRKTQFFSLIHPENLDENKRRIEALLEGRELQFEIENRYIAKSGARSGSAISFPRSPMQRGSLLRSSRS